LNLDFFEKIIGSEQDQDICFDFYKKFSLRVIQDITNDDGSVFFAMVFIFTKNQNDFVTMCCTHHNQR